MLMSPDQWFENPASGMRMRMTQLPQHTGGREFTAEYSYRPRGGKNAFPPHVHPHTTETFHVLSGRGRYLLDGKEGTVGVGETVVFPANVSHIHPWSDSDEPFRARQHATAEPADMRGLVNALQAAITIFGLANAGRVKPNGLPGLLQISILAHETIPQTYLGGVPRFAQTVGTGVLSVVARMAGYRFAYPEYGIVTDQGIEIPAPAA